MRPRRVKAFHGPRVDDGLGAMALCFMIALLFSRACQQARVVYRS
jgi:hypothetical protein